MAGIFLLVCRAACLLAAGAALGLFVNAVRPHGVDLRTGPSPSTPSACAQPPVVSNAETRSIDVLSLEQAASLCGDSGTLVADARTADEFAHGHVTGAIHLPCASSQGAASAALDLLAGKQTLIVYGNSTDDATPVADEMRRRSDRPDVRVAVLAGGFPAWSRAQLACSSGPCADCGGQVHR